MAWHGMNHLLIPARSLGPLPSLFDLPRHRPSLWWLSQTYPYASLPASSSCSSHAIGKPSLPRLLSHQSDCLPLVFAVRCTNVAAIASAMANRTCMHRRPG